MIFEAPLYAIHAGGHTASIDHPRDLHTTRNILERAVTRAVQQQLRHKILHFHQLLVLKVRMAARQRGQQRIAAPVSLI